MAQAIVSYLAYADRSLTSIFLPLLLLSLTAVGFYCYSSYAAIDFFGRSHQIDLDFHPPVTILKPICGLDSDAYENLASFCRQDYPEYQIVFGVRDEQDLGIAVVKQIIEDFPELDLRLVVSDRTIGANLKVSNLANAAAEAKYPLLLIADSDIRVGSEYLRRVIQPLRDQSVGVVTCLYRSLVQGWVAAFEALEISTKFQPGVLVARQLDGLNFALGSTILLRTAALNAIGGFKAIADYLADDYQLGHLAAQAGYKVVISDYVVEHVLATESISDLIQRQIRWARCIRVSRIWGYLGLIFTHGTATSLLFLFASKGSMLGWVILVLTWSTRLAMAWIVGVKSLQDAVVRGCLWLVPLRDLLSFALWCYSLLGNNIEWRGRRLKLIKGGKLVVLTADKIELLANS
ncbi:MAG: bacteriohopanetetrol glucosamine biosynthesis glycosyltransferase HpnI [Chroococcidiopsidaceae cyanobacterium CP_BM_ER_R8_30]|nr:bacteriohopanetetrol glucosamine biosynthesis glycosyltransferase HpnI [Chroococcidiopsidaceae cyanobacterium CP_BM_ER_R8_30]